MKYLLWAFFFCLSLNLSSQEFINKVRALYKSYSPVMQKAGELVIKGDTAAANRLILDHVPEGKRQLEHYFFLGNLLFSYDVKKSFELHKKSYELAPENHSVILEYAMQKHRAQEFAEAVKLYKDYLKKVPQDAVKYSLLAECQIYTNDLKGAVESWEKANHPKNHTSIDFMIYAINGKLHPTQRRSDLIKNIKMKKKSVEELIILDCNFDFDWWNEKVFTKGLELDLKFSEKHLVNETDRFKELKIYSELEKALNELDEDYSNEAENKSKEITRKILSSANLILGKNGRLPKSSIIASQLISKALYEKLVDKKTLIKNYGEALWSRTKSASGDLEALKILGHLYFDDEEVIKKINNLGWEKYKEPRFYLSNLVLLISEEDINSSNRNFQEALKKIPANPELTKLHLMLAQKEKKPIKDILVQSIKNEYKELSIGLAIRDSYRLKSLFSYLEKEL